MEARRGLAPKLIAGVVLLVSGLGVARLWLGGPERGGHSALPAETGTGKGRPRAEDAPRDEGEPGLHGENPATRRSLETPPDAERGEEADPVDDEILPDPLSAEGSKTIHELQRTAADASRSTSERVAALALLRRIELEHGTKPLRPSRTITAILQLLEGESDPALRSRICDESRGVLEPWHKDMLMRVLVRDVNAAVRARAAGALRELQSEADVREALVEASWSDADENVRAVAEEAVQNWEDDF